MILILLFFSFTDCSDFTKNGFVSYEIEANYADTIHLDPTHLSTFIFSAQYGIRLNVSIPDHRSIPVFTENALFVQSSQLLISNPNPYPVGVDLWVSNSTTCKNSGVFVYAPDLVSFSLAIKKAVSPFCIFSLSRGYSTTTIGQPSDSSEIFYYRPQEAAGVMAAYRSPSLKTSLPFFTRIKPKKENSHVELEYSHRGAMKYAKDATCYVKNIQYITDNEGPVVVDFGGVPDKVTCSQTSVYLQNQTIYITFLTVCSVTLVVIIVFISCLILRRKQIFGGRPEEAEETFLIDQIPDAVPIGEAKNAEVRRFQSNGPADFNDTTEIPRFI